MSQITPPVKPLFFACLGSILIGFSGIFIRLSDLGPLTTGFYRMLFALPFLALWMKLEQEKGMLLSLFPAKAMLSLALAGAFFACDLALWNWSVDYTTIVNSTLFNNTAPFFVPLIMWGCFRQKQSLRFIITASIAFIGCVLLVGESFTISLKSLLGDIVALGSGVMVAFYLICLVRIREGISTGLLMFWTGGFSLLILAFFAYVSGESFWPLTFKDLVSVVGQALLVHVVGQSFLAYSLGKIPANFVAIILLLAPLTGAVLGWVVYDEALTILKLFGMTLIMGSIIAVRKKS